MNKTIGSLVGAVGILSLSHGLTKAQNMEILPDNIVSIIARAASNQDADVFASLCGPDSREMARAICTVSEQEEYIFRPTMSMYASAIQTGEIDVNGMEARIPVEGTVQDGTTEKGVLVLKQKNGTWYLFDAIANDSSDNSPDSFL